MVLAATVVLASMGRYLIFAVAMQEFNPAELIGHLCRWDCGWYRNVADGYLQGVPSDRTGTADWAFFPLYPMITGLFSSLSGLSWPVAGFLVSNTCGLAAAGIARPLFGSNVRAYWLFSIGLLLGPFSLLFSLAYSESLFILLTLAGMLSLRRSRYVSAGTVGALLSSTRVTGVLFGLAIAVQALLDRLRADRSWRSACSLFTDPRILLALVIAPLGLIAYAVFLRLWMGDGLAFMHVQIGWNRELDNPLVQLWNGAREGFPFKLLWTEETSFVWAALAGFVLISVLVAKKRYAEAIFCLAALCLSLSAGLASTLRFVAGLAPLGVVLAEVLASRRWLTWIDRVLYVG